MTTTSLAPPGIISWYHYDHGPGIPTRLADLDMLPGPMMAKLILQARRHAPESFQRYLESRCVIPRPTTPGRMFAWDAVAEMCTWSMLANDLVLFSEAKDRIRKGECVRVSWDPIYDTPTLYRLVTL